MTALGPYESPEEHLHEELRRTWLRVEALLRRRWEQEAAAATDSPALGSLRQIPRGGLYDAAHAADAQRRGGPVPGQGEASTPEALFAECSLALETRIAASRQAGTLPPLIALADRFALTPTERLALTFAIMPELDPQLLVAYRTLAGDASCRGLDARLLALLVYQSPVARTVLVRDLAPTSPLVRYRLLEIDESNPAHDSMLLRRLRPAARVVELVGGGALTLDPELADVAELRRGVPAALLPAALVERAAAALGAQGILCVVQGMRGVGKRLLIEAAAARRGQPLLLVDGQRIAPLGHTSPTALRPLVRSLLREARLFDAVVAFADLDAALGATGAAEGGVPPLLGLFAAEYPGAIAITLGRDRVPLLDLRPLVHLPLEVLPRGERARLWQMHVAGLDAADAETLATRFAAPGGVIVRAAQAALAESTLTGRLPDPRALDQAVRSQLHDRIARLGRKLDTPHHLDDLIVDEDTKSALLEIIGCMQERTVVRERWGFRGAAGVSVLFSGDPGVGKTMSATVIAQMLGLAIYEIDLSRVVSKWLGETEKNLAEVFDAAEPGHVVLLFNEADSLFGKRTSDVKSANDRYANMETNYLLQRLERFGGLAILTTNLGKALDPAFRRRFAYDVQFSFPTPEMRAQLWEKTIPAAAEADALDFTELAERFELSGGFIKVAAERAAFSAASAGAPLDMATLLLTIERMYRERGKLTAVGKLE